MPFELSNALSPLKDEYIIFLAFVRKHYHLVYHKNTIRLFKIAFETFQTRAAPPIRTRRVLRQTQVGICRPLAWKTFYFLQVTLSSSFDIVVQTTKIFGHSSSLVEFQKTYERSFRFRFRSNFRGLFQIAPLFPVLTARTWNFPTTTLEILNKNTPWFCRWRNVC